MNASAAWVYRQGGRREPVRTLLADLAARLARRTPRGTLDALVDAGAVESALADACHPAMQLAADLTDRLAELALGLAPGPSVDALAAVLTTRDDQGLVWLAPAEGFAYYALHPLAYARAAAAIPSPALGSALVLGVRSIGTTLSAVVAASLRARGVRAARHTVRPTGSPFERTLDPSPEVARAMSRARDEAASVLVVDEGPGASGSTLLATAEAAVRAGIPRDLVTILCSHEPDPAALVAPDAARRWASFRHRASPTDLDVPVGAELSAGAWRERVLPDERRWPASWVSREHRKWLVGGTLVKFEGLGRTGDEVLARAESLASASFAPAPHPRGPGLVAYPWLERARPLTPADLDERVVDHVARYCAARPSLCPPSGPPEDLGPMVRKNLHFAFGDEVAARAPRLEVVRPAIVDGRMMPHEWLRDGERIVKVDGASHGDDHFFPGPTDIAWDLAGFIVEWRLAAAARARLLDRYARASGDDARPRIAGWIAAYLAFRAGYLAVAARELAASAEGLRLARALARHLETGAGWLGGPPAGSRLVDSPSSR